MVNVGSTLGVLIIFIPEIEKLTSNALRLAPEQVLNEGSSYTLQVDLFFNGFPPVPRDRPLVISWNLFRDDILINFSATFTVRRILLVNDQKIYSVKKNNGQSGIININVLNPLRIEENASVIVFLFIHSRAFLLQDKNLDLTYVW
ncbi:MAG: hypothetical protein ACFFCI_06920 [Promethearchaeota archaeon]